MQQRVAKTVAAKRATRRLSASSSSSLSPSRLRQWLVRALVREGVLEELR